MDRIEILGFIAAACTTIAFLPQAVKTWRDKQTKDLSLPMFLIFSLGIALWLIYGFLILNWPLIIANSITFVLSGTILYHKIKYG